MIHFLSDPALAKVWDTLPDARVVGGAVRDALVGLPLMDIDLATPQPPEAVVAALKQAGLKVVPTGLAHGTVTAVVDGRGFEVTTLRRDVETDGRHAVVQFTTDWQQDASRRDFTINAMSMGRDGTVYDYFGGKADLAAGRVRFVGDPATRIAEDYLRILRFFRFYARFGRVPSHPRQDQAPTEEIGSRDGATPSTSWPGLSRSPTTYGAKSAKVGGGQTKSGHDEWDDLPASQPDPDAYGGPPDPATLDALKAGIPGLARLSIERVWHELRLILAAPKPEDAVRLMDRLGIWAAVVPEAAAISRLDDLPADPILRLASMLTGNALVLASRLKLSNEDRDRLVRLHATPSPSGSHADLRRLLADHLQADLIDRTWLDNDEPVRQRLSGMKRPRFPLEGRDVVALGVSPGPAVGALLSAVRQWWMDGGCTADRRACLAELARRAESTNMGDKR